MRCPYCNTLFAAGTNRDTWSTCPHCEAPVWIGSDADIAQSEREQPPAEPDVSTPDGETIEIDLSCPGMNNPSTGIALTRYGDIGVFRDLSVFVDGLRVGRIAHQQRKVFRVQPGSRAVHVSMDWCTSEPYQIDVAEGEIVELRCGPGSSAGRFKLNTFKALFTPNRFFVVERVD